METSGKSVDTISSIPAAEFAEILLREPNAVFDVRKDNEYLSQRLENAQHSPLDFINDHLDRFPKESPFYLYCAGGYRSIIAASILKKRGVHNLINVEGGFKAILKTQLPLTDYVCLSTL